MAPMEQDYPSEISLPVPAVYRRYLLGKRILASLFGMVIIILGIVFVPYITSHPHRTPPYFMFYFCLIFLVSEISDEIRGWKQTRLFTINRKFMTIPSAYLRALRQQCVTWFTDAIVSVERFEWHGLPALQIVVEGKRRKNSSDRLPRRGPCDGRDADHPADRDLSPPPSEQSPGVDASDTVTHV